jgi:imidazolonepropionase-like amidohydrolase
VEESHHLSRKVAAHCHGDAAAKMAVIAGVDSIEHGSFLKPDTCRLYWPANGSADVWKRT